MQWMAWLDPVTLSPEEGQRVIFFQQPAGVACNLSGATLSGATLPLGIIRIDGTVTTTSGASLPLHITADIVP